VDPVLRLQPYDSDVAVEPHQRSLVDQQQRTLGPDHPDTLTTAEWIASIRYDLP
jgi:hypothetical protein